jgi:hypothetical protein
MIGCSIVRGISLSADAPNPLTGVTLETAIIPAAAALVALIVLFVVDKVRKSKRK